MFEFAAWRGGLSLQNQLSHRPKHKRSLGLGAGWQTRHHGNHAVVDFRCLNATKKYEYRYLYFKHGKEGETLIMPVPRQSCHHAILPVSTSSTAPNSAGHSSAIAWPASWRSAVPLAPSELHSMMTDPTDAVVSPSVVATPTKCNATQWMMGTAEQQTRKRDQ